MLVASRARATAQFVEVGGATGVSWIDAKQLHLRYAVEPRPRLQLGVRALYDGSFGDDLEGNDLSEWAVAAEARWVALEGHRLSFFLEAGAGVGQVVIAGCGDEYDCFQGGPTPYARVALGLQLSLGRFFASVEGELGDWWFVRQTGNDGIDGPGPPLQPTDGTTEVAAFAVVSLGAKLGR